MGSVVFRFVVLGPMFGALAFLLTGGAFEYANAAPDPVSVGGHEALSSIVFGGIAVWGFGTVLAFVVAGIPAAFCGMVYWFILKRFSSGNIGFLLRGLAGGGLGCLCAAVYGGVLFSHASDGNNFVSFISWAIAGLFGGAIPAISIGQATYDLVFGNSGRRAL